MLGDVVNGNLHSVPLALWTGPGDMCSQKWLKIDHSIHLEKDKATIGLLVNQWAFNVYYF